MITVIVTLTQERPVSELQARILFRELSASFIRSPGLVWKHFALSVEANCATAIYHWKDRQSAEPLLNGNFGASLAQKFGVVPEIKSFERCLTEDSNSFDRLLSS